MAYTAAAMYTGNIGTVQPTGVPEPLHQGSPEPAVLTRVPGRRDNPILALVVILGVVVLLTQVTFRGTIDVSG